jgi:hypothetical protein
MKNSYKCGGGATGNKDGPNGGYSSEGGRILQEQSGKQGVTTTGNHNKGDKDVVMKITDLQSQS